MQLCCVQVEGGAVVVGESGAVVVGESGAVVVGEDVQVSSRDPRTGPCTDLGMEGGWVGEEIEVQWVVLKGNALKC